MSLSGAITNLQAKAKALTTVSIKAAPDGPLDSTLPFPASITYLSSGSAIFQNASSARIDVVLTQKLYFPRTMLPTAYDNIVAAAFELVKAVAKDPTLGGNVVNVINPTFEVLQEAYNQQELVVLAFQWPTKSLEAPA